MKNTKTLEALVGGFVVLGILALVFLAYKVSAVNNVGKNGTYTVYADFHTVSGLKKGAAVTLAGVKVGQVDTISLNKETHKARVAVLIDKQYDNLPLDTSVSVLTEGLLGEKYLGLDVGADTVFLEDGDAFEFVKSAIVLERMIDRFLLNSSGSK